MKKCFTLSGLIFFAFIFLFPSNCIFAQPGPFTINVIVNSKDNLPLENAKVILASNDHFSDIQIKTTDASGKVQLTAKYGGAYELDIYRDTYVSKHTNFNINKYGDEKQFFLVYELDKKYTTEKKVTSSTYFVIKGKDENGNINPIKGAIVYTLFGNFVTDYNGFVNASHTMGKGDEFPYYIEADGFQPVNGISVIDEEKIIYWSNNKPDKVEIILNPIKEEDYGKLKSGQFVLNVLVLNSENDTPIPEAMVDLKMRKPYEGKTTFSMLRTDSKGIARFEGVHSALIQNELYVTGTHDNFEEKWSDVTPTFFSDLSAKEFLFTLYLNSKSQSTKKYVLEDVKCGNEREPRKDDHIDQKTWSREYKYGDPKNNTKVEFNNLGESFPKGINPNDNLTLKIQKKLIGPLKLENVKVKAVWATQLNRIGSPFDISESGTTLQVPPEIYDEILRLIIYIEDPYDFMLGWMVVTYKIQK